MSSAPNLDLSPVAPAGTLEQVPVIDLRGDPAVVIDAVGAACRDWGFFQVVGHGVPGEAILGVQKTARTFFALPRDADGVGELVDPGEVPAEAVPTAVTQTPSALPVGPAQDAAAAPVEEAGSPLVPVTLGGTAVLIVAMTLIGRRRATRPQASSPASGSSEAVSPPPPTGGSPSTRR